MNPRRPWCHILGAAIGALAVAPIMIMLFDRREPLELIDGYITPFNVRGGQEVRITWVARELRACGGELHKLFIDSAKVAHPTVREPTVYHQTFADERTFQKLMTIPRGMAPGPAIYTTKIERWCNPLQKYLWPIKSDGIEIRFNVVE